MGVWRMTTTETFMPLTGVRVLDLTWHVAGPFGTRLLADYGADVIKIEMPGTGDPARDLPPFYKDEPGLENSGLFLFLNTSKRSVTLDLKSPRGKELLLELVKKADVLVESFNPRVMPSLGLDYETLSAANPKLVMASISNFGQTGPYRDWKATDLTTYAMGGAMINTGHPEKEPLTLGGHIPSFQVGTVSAAATSIALIGADATGEGDHLDLGAFPIWMGAIDRRQSYLMSHQYTNDISTRPWPASALGTGIWQCTDGFFMTSVGPGLFPRMARMLGAEHLLQDSNWATPAARSHPDRLDESIALIIPWMLERTKAEARNAAQEYGVYGGPVNSFADLVNDEHFRHRGFFTEIDHPTTGPITYPGYSVKLHFDEGEMPPRRRAPLLGEHTDEVLRDDLGLDAQQIAELHTQGVV